MLKGIVNDLNIKKQAEDLEISVWQTPGFLFSVMGIIIMAAMALVYFVSSHYDSPEILVISETAIVIIILAIGGSLIKNIETFTETNKMKSEFISIASHQLKTPLSEIKWGTELFLSQHKNGVEKDFLDFVEKISESNSKMIKLVNNLLNITRISQKKFSLKKEQFDILEILSKAVRENKILAKTKNVKISLIDATKNNSFAIGDRRGIKAVVDNLLSNAIKFTREGIIKININRKKNKIIVCVKDSGVGIPKNEQERVFQKFFRGSNEARFKTEGTGLGLYLAKSIIEQCGGKMWFKSEEGEGSTFCFSLPSHKSTN
ncbi:HAMP domain-containing histidine kinase [bacterium]|nr:HAMP domain-containing histidine kinase [bacterium]